MLKIFLLDPAGRFYLRQIQDLTGHPLQAVQRETNKLVAIGLPILDLDGSHLYYSIARSFPIFPELKVIS